MSYSTAKQIQEAHAAVNKQDQAVVLATAKGVRDEKKDYLICNHYFGCFSPV